MSDKWIYWFEELGTGDNDRVGKKCANLGEMTRLGLRIPPGFAISIEGYERFMVETGAGEEIRRYVRENRDRLGEINYQIQASKAIRDIIESQEMPPDLREELFRHYDQLRERAGGGELSVAVRSSGSVSMPGQMESYLNVRRKETVLQKVIQVWGSAFTTRAIAFRLEKGLALDKAPIGIAVLKMVEAKSAGVILTVLPTNGDLTKVIVEGNWGLGESVVSGEINPDQYIVDKNSGLVERTINRKTKMVVYHETGTITAEVPAEIQDTSCLEAEELKEIVRIAKEVETHFQAPQDMEWVLDRFQSAPENLYWVQARPAKYSNVKEQEAGYLAELMTRLFKM